MRSRPVAIALAIIAVLVLSSSAVAAGPPLASDPQPVIVVFEDSVASPATEAADLTAAYGARPTFIYSHALKGFAATLPVAAVNALRANPKIRWVEHDGQTTLADTTQTPATWGLDRVDQRDLPLNNAYTYAATGNGVQAYVIDSGIKFDHVDFGGRATLGADYVGDGQNGVDCNGHGTHVAGTIGGQTYGVAKGISLIAVRTHDCAGNSTWSKIIAAVDFVTGQKQIHPSTPMVANMSIQGSPDAATDTAVANSISAGVNYAVAAGNGALFGGDACNSTPARVAAAMTVGATDSSDARAFYSNYGSCVDWFAPGSGITSDGISSTTATAVKDGTSMAAPHTAGVAALYLQDHPNATPQEVRDALFQATTKGKVTSANSTNNHLLYSLFAPADFSISASPATLSLVPGASGTSAISTTQVGSAGSVGLVASVSPSATGVTAAVSPASVAAGAGATLTVTVGASATTGSYTVTVTGTEGAATHSTTVAVTVTASPQPADFSISASPATLSLGRGTGASSTGSSTISTAVTSGSAQTVTLSVSGLPAGATATLSPTSVTAGASSTLTVTAGTATTGSYTVTITGIGTSATHTTSVSLTVTDFSLSASPTSRSIRHGQSTSYGITITRLYGFAGSVAFTVTGVPANATASVTPASTTGTSATLSVSTSGSSPRGTYTLQITGTSGGLTHSIAVSLTVT